MSVEVPGVALGSDGARHAAASARLRVLSPSIQEGQRGVLEDGPRARLDLLRLGLAARPDDPSHEVLPYGLGAKRRLEAPP